MDFQLSAEQEALAEVARDFLTANSGVAGARAALDGDRSLLPDVRQDLVKLGLLGLLADEAHDGGGTLLDLAVVAEQAGRTLTPAPLVAVAGRAVPLLTAVAEPAAEALLRKVLDNAVVVAVADGTLVLAEDGTVSGTVDPVVGGRDAEVLLALAAPVGGEPSLVALTVGVGVATVEQEPLDPTRALARFTIENASPEVLATGAAVVAAWRRAQDLATVVLAAEDLGTTAECVARAVEYAKERTAFGRRIGSFQAVKHQLVECYVAEEQLRSLVWLAAWSAEAEPENLGLYASAAAAYAAPAAERAAEVLIQVHGGIGFTWEHDAHLFWRRAKVDRLLLGDEHTHKAAVAERLLAGAVTR